MKKVISSSFVIIVALLFTGCGLLNRFSKTVDSVDGKKSAELDFSESIPESWPKELAFPDDITISKTVTNTKNNSIVVAFTSEAVLKDIAEFYIAEMTDQGWEITTNTVTDQAIALSAKKNNQVLAVIAAVNPTRGNITQATVTLATQ